VATRKSCTRYGTGKTPWRLDTRQAIKADSQQKKEIELLLPLQITIDFLNNFEHKKLFLSH